MFAFTSSWGLDGGSQQFLQMLFIHVINSSFRRCPDTHCFPFLLQTPMAHFKRVCVFVCVCPLLLKRSWTLKFPPAQRSTAQDCTRLTHPCIISPSLSHFFSCPFSLSRFSVLISLMPFSHRTMVFSSHINAHTPMKWKWNLIFNARKPI